MQCTQYIADCESNEDLLLMMAAPASSPVRFYWQCKTVLLSRRSALLHITICFLSHCFKQCWKTPPLRHFSLYPSLPFYHPPSTHHICERLQKSSLLTGFITHVEKVPLHQVKLNSCGWSICFTKAPINLNYNAFVIQMEVGIIFFSDTVPCIFLFIYIRFMS